MQLLLSDFLNSIHNGTLSCKAVSFNESRGQPSGPDDLFTLIFSNLSSTMDGVISTSLSVGTV